MSIYEKNLEFLKIENFKNINYENNIEIVKAEDGEDTLILNEKGKSVYLHSSYSPKEVSKVLVDGFLEKRTAINKVIIVYGIGLGYEVEYLLERLEEEKFEGIIYLVENNECIFKKYLQKFDITKRKENTKVRYIVGKDSYETAKYKEIRIHNFERLAILKTPSYVQVYKEEYAKFLKSISDISIINSINRNTTIKFSKKWVEKNIINFKNYLEVPDINKFSDFIEGKPAILVSAGPSLDKNIHLLKEAKGKFFILCVYTAYKALQQHGIEPDLVFSVDSFQPVYKKHKEEGLNVPLIGPTMLNDELIDANKNKTLIYATQGFSEDFMPKNRKDDVYSILEESGTVAASALSLLTQFKANPIVLVGQDLGYPDGKTHVSGSYYDEKELSDSGYKRDELIIKGNYTDNFVTDTMMYSFLIWFNNFIPKKIKELNIKYINATEGGAYIEGTEIMTLREVLDKYSEDDNIDEQFIKNINTHKLFDDEQKLEFYNNIKNIQQNVSELLEIATDAVEEVEKLEELYKYTNYPKQNKVDECITKLSKIDDEIKEKQKKFSILGASFYYATYLLENFDEVNEELNDKQKIIQKDKFFHVELKKVVDELNTLLENSIKDMNETYNFE